MAVLEDVFLKPIEGVIVRDPITGAPLDKKGEYKPWYGSGLARYWRRRVRDGSVIICNPPTQEKQETELRDRKRTRRKEDKK